MEQLTKLQIIDETVEYYSTHPRSLRDDESSNCMYNGDNNTKCAFSRCCTDDSIFDEGSSACAQKYAVLLPQYAYIPYDDVFWIEIQYIHDTNSFWKDGNFTDLGEEYVDNLKTKYNETNN